MNKRLINILKKAHSVRLAMIDAYCQKIHEDISCTILTNIDTANNHFIMEPAILTHKRNEFGKRLRKDYEQGKVKIQRKYTQQIEPRNDGLSNTLTSVEKDNLVIEPTKEIAAMRGREQIVLGWTRDKHGNVVNRHPVSIANPVNSAKRDNTQNYVVDQFRIRKLTERECFRLMGVADEDSDKIRQVVSKTQCYKLAGNSIVVDVLVAIFKQLFSEDRTTDKQLKLF